MVDISPHHLSMLSIQLAKTLSPHKRRQCRVTILGPKSKVYGVLVQWAQYNEFVENELETWILTNQTINQQV